MPETNRTLLHQTGKLCFENDVHILAVLNLLETAIPIRPNRRYILKTGTVKFIASPLIKTRSDWKWQLNNINN